MGDGDNRVQSLDFVEVEEDDFPLALLFGGLLPFDDFALRLDFDRLQVGLGRFFGRGFGGQVVKKPPVNDDKLAGRRVKITSPVGAGFGRRALLGDCSV